MTVEFVSSPFGPNWSSGPNSLVFVLQVEDTDMELPKIYEPIESFKALEERLKYFLDQYNDIIRGSDMDLVFFPDAVIHLIKISRVIRNPGGNMMLVGVGGSGQSFLVAVKMQKFLSFFFQMEFTDSGSQSMDSPPREIKMMDAVAVVSGDIRYEINIISLI